MTTPRDDIGLSELRTWGDADLSFMEGDIPSQMQAACREAATQLDAQAARERIERNRDMRKGQCERQAAQLTSLRADNDKMHDLVDQLTQALHDAEAKCDEAYERAAKACEQVQEGFLSPGYAIPQPAGSISERFACGQCAAAIRQIASGPDKEKRD